MATDDKGKLMQELMDRMAGVEPLAGEEDFFTSSQTLMRFLKARDWKVKDAEKLLKAAVEWRRKTKPLESDCRWCHEKPGYHCLRQVGFDEMGRPVFYSSFSQAAVRNNSVEDSLAHLTYLIENAKRTMRPGVMSWVLIIDCTGMSLPACNPKLGYGVTQVMSNFYPERLGLVICVNTNRVFQGVWKAIKVFLHPNTVSKMHLVRSKKRIRELFERLFSEELSEWLREEMTVNKQRPLPKAQRQFWVEPQKGVHDPRGAPSYVRDWVEPYGREGGSVPGGSLHRPHPNMIDHVQGKLKGISLENDAYGDSDGAMATPPETNGDGSDVDDDEDEPVVLDIDEEFQIPKDATHLQM